MHSWYHVHPVAPCPFVYNLIKLWYNMIIALPPPLSLSLLQPSIAVAKEELAEARPAAMVTRARMPRREKSFRSTRMLTNVNSPDTETTAFGYCCDCCVTMTCCIAMTQQVNHHVIVSCIIVCSGSHRVYKPV